MRTVGAGTSPVGPSRRSRLWSGFRESRSRGGRCQPCVCFFAWTAAGTRGGGWGEDGGVGILTSPLVSSHSSANRSARLSVNSCSATYKTCVVLAGGRELQLSTSVECGVITHLWPARPLFSCLIWTKLWFSLGYEILVRMWVTFVFWNNWA